MIEHDPNETYELLPEGIYTLQIREEPEARRQTSRNGKEYIYYIFKFTATNAVGESTKYNDILVRWNPIFTDLLIACGFTIGDDGKYHVSEKDMIGKQFKAEIKHKPNPNNADEIRAKIVKIETNDDDVPF
ncbi:MAG: hypothetical protein GTO16_01265 [Candidatus Aminicenantes bacterium]|nr:hypothetical protein [Candidatus Aminicenantes bacterium]